MTQWIAHENQNVTSKDVYDILSRHKLLPMNPAHAAALCNSIADSGFHYEVREAQNIVANVFVTSVIDGESAVFDLIPVPRNFRVGFDEPISEACEPILTALFNERHVRRITAYAPYSRSRTKRALCALGFVHEGRIQQGIHLHGEEPEDLRILGLIREDYDA